MGIIDIFYTACRLGTKTATPTLTGFQGLNIYIKYLNTRPRKQILYPYNSYYGYNVTRLTWNIFQV